MKTICIKYQKPSKWIFWNVPKISINGNHINNSNNPNEVIESKVNSNEAVIKVKMPGNFFSTKRKFPLKGGNHSYEIKINFITYTINVIMVILVIAALTLELHGIKSILGIDTYDTFLAITIIWGICIYPHFLFKIEEKNFKSGASHSVHFS